MVRDATKKIKNAENRSNRCEGPWPFLLPIIQPVCTIETMQAAAVAAAYKRFDESRPNIKQRLHNRSSTASKPVITPTRRIHTVVVATRTRAVAEMGRPLSLPPSSDVATSDVVARMMSVVELPGIQPITAYLRSYN